ncbi:coiled-coil domain-containing protein 13-like [Polistes fuscatus]|uniref:coiled-coil domain-containing protein 13-like n=1 Tax=Polistes fuscatus TaxID=30207 RepID=UPI001CA9CFFA|nr:coiled-coil domain-containing protein 13-like [Polistes fuscatus]
MDHKNNFNESYDFEDIVTWPKEMIEDLTAENGCLRRTLEETEEKLRITEKSTTIKSKLPITLDKSNEMATIKITELSKKCKEQTTEIEVLKTKCKHLEDNLCILDKGTGDVQSLSKENEDKMKILTDKLQQVKTKLYESKNAYTSLKQDFNKAQKLLCREVGDNVTVTGLSSQLGGWRGRAEQIRILQQKIVELQNKLSEYDGTLKGSFVSSERKNLANLRNAEKERRQQIENSAKELRQAEVALETYKRKLEASKARIKVLENELNGTKANVAVLNEKRSHDDHLIETLNNRLKSVENKYQEREIDIKNKEDKIERECINVKNDLQAAQIQIDRLTRKLDEREIEIDKLRNGLMIPEDQKLQRTINSHTEDRNVVNNYRRSPPSTIKNLNEPNEYVTIAIAAEAERERLLELVIVLNRRLDKERNDANSLAESLRNERYKLAKLESKLRKLENERAGISKVDSGFYKIKNFRSTSGSKTNEEFANTEQIRFKLELLEEECLALKARLNTVQQDKASDLETYKRMLDQARKTFQEACKNKPTITPASRSTVTV